MTTLSSALSHALSGLKVTSAQSALVARNISRASEEGYTRKYASLTTELDGSARVGSINRNAEKQLLDVFNTAQSSSQGQKFLLGSLGRLQQTVGDVSDEGSVAAGINDFQNKLKLLESNPTDSGLASTAINAASNLVHQLNTATSVVQGVRAEADSGIKASVVSINTLLARLQDVNTRIVNSPANDEGIVEAFDTRDQILKDLSAEIGIRTVSQPDNGVSVYTDGGVTLFNQVARQVSFIPSIGMGATSIGNAVYADGVGIVGPGAQMPTRQGKLAAFAEMRDVVAPTYQNQLDEIARGLIVAFAEKDTTAVQPDATGLFTFPGAPAVPFAANVVSGLAGTIRINPAFDRSRGGNPMLLRDGGANGPAYVANTTGQSGFQQRITSLISTLDENMTFATETQLSTQVSLKELAASSAGWLEGLRTEASSRSQYLSALSTRAGEALSRATGVNIDDEMSMMLNLERSYQAAAKVITVVDQMFASLLAVVR